MIEKNLVFITGAGASIDFGFPTGIDLIRMIVEFKWESVENASSGLKIDEQYFIDFTNKLKFSNTPSIDIFLANNSEYADLAKMIIAKIISASEKVSGVKLFENGWLKYLWFKMVEGCRNFEDFKNNKVKFVTFNYDRSLEFFFIFSVANFFKKEDNNLFWNKDIFKTVPVYHVFGKIGNLKWENSEKYRTMDNQLGTYKSWFELGSELNTIYEAEKSELQKTIIKTISEADEIHFLGFGYNSFNLNFLELDSWETNQYISGTRYHLSNAEISDINYLFNNKLRKVSDSMHRNCLDYLKDEVCFFVPKKIEHHVYKGL